MATPLQETGILGVAGTPKPLSPRSPPPKHGASPVATVHKLSKVEELLVRLQDVQRRISSAYAELHEDVPRDIRQAMGSKVAELIQRAQRRQQVRDSLQISPTSAVDDEATPTVQPIEPTAVSPPTEHVQQLIEHAKDAGPIPVTVPHSACTADATNTEAQFETYFAEVDREHPVRRMPTELLHQIHMQAGRAPRRASLTTVKEPEQRQPPPRQQPALNPLPSIAPPSSGVPPVTVPSRPAPAPAPAAPSHIISDPPAGQAPAATKPLITPNKPGQAKQELQQSHNHDTKPTASSTSLLTARRVSSRAILINNSVKDSGTRDPSSVPSPPVSNSPVSNNMATKAHAISRVRGQSQTSSSISTTGVGTLGVTLAVAKFKRGRDRLLEARSGPAPPLSGATRRNHPSNQHRRVTVPSTTMTIVPHQETTLSASELVRGGAWEGDSVYAEARLYV